MVRWTNVICGALLTIAALGFLMILPANIADYSREAEDLWLGGFWIFLLALVAALCFTNAKGSFRQLPFGWLTFANLAVLIGLASLLFLDDGHDLALVALIAVSGLGPVVALFASMRQSHVKRS